MMEWLVGRLPVPRVLAFEQAGGVNWLLMNRVRGEMLCAERFLARPQWLISLLTQCLRLLWQVDPAGCPQVCSLDRTLTLAEERVRRGLCSVEDAEPETYGEGGFRPPEHLLAWLKDNRPEEELVFSHGDCCLPNLFADESGITGMIDLGRSGIADRYQDIALCVRSLKHNVDGTYGGNIYAGVNAGDLFDALGMRPDWKKIRYYTLLDELF